MKTQYLILVLFGLFSLMFSNQAFSEVDYSKNNDTPKLLIDLSQKDHWDGLNTSSDYWKIQNNKGYFYLVSNTPQIEPAVYDLKPFLEDDINDEWILTYTLRIDDYVQSSSNSWAELMIGLYDNPSNAVTDQWGVGLAFLNGAGLNLTHMMYDQGSYNKWHCCPVKAKFVSDESSISSGTSFFIEYVKTKSTFTVNLYDMEKNLIEQQNFATLDSSPNLRYFKIFPLVEDKTVDGMIKGQISDIIFYNGLDELSGSELIPDEPDTPSTSLFDENPPQEPPLIGLWMKPIVKLWISNELSDSDFFEKISFLIENDSKLIPYLSDYEDLDTSLKAKSFEIPSNPKCLTCIAEKQIILKWDIPSEISEKGANFEISITTPTKQVLKFMSPEKILPIKITNDFTPGIYNVIVTYGTDIFEIPPFVLIDSSENNERNSIPFWIKYDLHKWSLDESSDDDLLDSIKYLLKENKIPLTKPLFEQSDEYNAPIGNPLEYVFPNETQIKNLRPQIWEYFGNATPAELLGEYSSVISAQKILSDLSREFDPIHNKHKVPFSLLQVFKFEKGIHAKEFLESQAFWSDPESVNNAEFYDYDEILMNGDSFGSSNYTGDCFYKNNSDISLGVEDETHVVICIKNNVVYQVFLYEDYPNIDSTLAFTLMDTMISNDNDEKLQIPLGSILKLKNIRDDVPSTVDPLITSQKSLPQDPENHSAQIGISNFTCIPNDFGSISIKGIFNNGERMYDNVVFDIIIEGYDGDLLAYGRGNIEKLSSFESRNFTASVQIDEPFYKCSASVDWNSSN